MLDQFDDYLSTHELKFNLPDELQSKVGDINVPLVEGQDVQEGRSKFSWATIELKFNGSIDHDELFIIFRPSFCTEDRHTVPFGPQIQGNSDSTHCYRYYRSQNMEGPHIRSAIVGPIRCYGHLQVYQAQSGWR